MPGKQEVTSFIRSSFRSVWSLELLCFLRKHQDRSWTRDRLVTSLRASELVVDQSIALLAGAGLVVVEDGGAVRYQPASAGLDALVMAVEELYATSPDKVRRIIMSSVSGGISAFADAFRVRRD
jgi:hypothetical protein